MANGKPKAEEPKDAPGPPVPAKPEIDKQGQENAERQKANVEVNKAEQAKVDPLMPQSSMNAEQAMAASPSHMIVPDPLPPLDRPIYQSPIMGAGHPPLELHPGGPSPQVEADVENFRTRLGEMREFLKRFPHTLAGDLGALVSHLRVALGVPVNDPIREADRLQEDKHIAERRRQEDLASGGVVDAALKVRRAEEDAGLATYRRIQDTPV